MLILSQKGFYVVQCSSTPLDHPQHQSSTAQRSHVEPGVANVVSLDQQAESGDGESRALRVVKDLLARL